MILGVLQVDHYAVGNPPAPKRDQVRRIAGALEGFFTCNMGQLEEDTKYIIGKLMQ